MRRLEQLACRRGALQSRRGNGKRLCTLKIVPAPPLPAPLLPQTARNGMILGLPVISRLSLTYAQATLSNADAGFRSDQLCFIPLRSSLGLGLPLKLNREDW